MLTLTDDETMLRDSARGFLAEAAPVSEFRKLRDSSDPTGYSTALWQQIAEMGWTGILVPEKFGGLDFGLTGAALVSAEMARTLTASPFLSTAVVGASILAMAGSETQQAQWLPAITEGRAVVALAVDEFRKHDPDSIAAEAVENGGDFRLSGQKVFVVDAHVADAFIVAARTAPPGENRSGITLFIVPIGAPGLTVTRTTTVDSRNFGEIQLEDVRVSPGDAIGMIGRGDKVLSRGLDAGRVAVSAELLGLAQEVFERTLGYLRERQQFGRLIGTNQALQHRCAHLYCELELAQSAVLAAARSFERGDQDAGAIVSLAKAKTADVARLAVSEAVQMHGGIGMTDEFDIGLYMKRVRVLTELFGDVAYHVDRVATFRGF